MSTATKSVTETTYDDDDDDEHEYDDEEEDDADSIGKAPGKVVIVFFVDCNSLSM